MKVFGLLVLSLLVVGCVEADSRPKFQTEEIGEAYWRIKRTVDLDYTIACYTHREMISCVKL